LHIIENFTTNNENYKAKQIVKMRGIMLHSVGCPQPDPEVFVRIFNDPSGKPNGRKVGVHAFVGSDGRVFQTMPWNFRAWHCGKGPNGSGNSTHIGIELVEPRTIKYVGGSAFQDNNPAASRAFVEATYKVGVELFSHLCKQHNFDPLADGVVVSHAEGHRLGIASNHGDVEHLWKVYGLTMDRFRQDIWSAMNAVSPFKPSAPAATAAPAPKLVEESVLKFNLLGQRLDIPGAIVDGKAFVRARLLVEGLGFCIDMTDGVIVVREKSSADK